MSIVVMADSGASLPKSVLKRKDICVMPLKIEFTDGKIGTLRSEEKFDETSCIPIIRRPNIMDIREEVTKYINKGYDVLYITISSKLSKEYKDLLELTNEFDSSQFSVVDSLNVGTGEALIVLEALECIDKGYGLKQISKYLNEIKSEVKSTYVISNFPFLYAQDICKDLMYKYIEFSDRYPVMNLNNGDTDVTFNSSSLSVAYQIVEDNIFDNISYTKTNEIIINYVSNKDVAEKIKHNLKRKFKNLNITLVKSNSFLSLCLGNNGISYSIINK